MINMTDKTKKRFSNYNDFSKALTLPILIIIGVMVFKGGLTIQNMKSHGFDSLEEKARTKVVVKQALTPIERYVAFERLASVERSVSMLFKFDSLDRIDDKLTLDKLNKTMERIEKKVNNLNK